jgi:hypothetical protein
MASFRPRTRRSASLPNDPVEPRTSASSVELFTLALVMLVLAPSDEDEHGLDFSASAFRIKCQSDRKPHVFAAGLNSASLTWNKF